MPRGTALAMLAVMVTSCVAQSDVVRMFQQCPDPVPLQASLDIARYMGKWFEYMVYPNTVGGSGSSTRCVIANYTLRADGSVRVVNVGLVPFHLDEHPDCELVRQTMADGEATVPDPATPARLLVRFSPYSSGGGYSVIETDYDSYSVVYNCEQTMMGAKEVAWILTRDREARGVDVDALKERMRAKGINPDDLQMSNQKGCPEWKGEFKTVTN